MYLIKATRTLAVVALLSSGGVALADEHSGAHALALGDSIAFGLINQAGHQFVNAANFISYPDYVGSALHLEVSNASCPGETSGSLLDASAVDHGCRGFRGAFPLHAAYDSTQLAYATAFLAKHPDTRLITITVGANDVFVLEDSCEAAINPVQCLQAGLPAVLGGVATHVGSLLATLRSTHFSGALVVTNYYSTDYGDPLLTALTAQLNQELAVTAQAYGATVANVYGAYQQASSGAAAGGSPCRAGLLNVDPQDTGQCDVHPSITGQRLIARAVLQALR
jgi:lysophospholipase L1-like esterase